MSMICFPPITDTAVSLSTPAGRPANQIAPNIRSRLRQIETSIDFCICLKIKDRIDNTGRCQCVRKIQERERNHNESGSFEENPLPWFVRDVEGAERKKCEHRQSSEGKNKHRERALHKIP